MRGHQKTEFEMNNFPGDAVDDTKCMKQSQQCLHCLASPRTLKQRHTLFSTCSTHTHTFNGRLSGTTRVSRYQKGKPIWILLKEETVSGSDISWAICKSAPRSRQITTPAPHQSFFTGRMPFPLPNQQRQSTEGN